MGYSGWGAAAGHWSPPPEDAYGYGLATYERSFGESPYGDVGGRYGFGHPPDDGGYFQQQRETTGENSNHGLSVAEPDAFQPRLYGDGYDIPVDSGTPQQQQQHQHQQDGTPPATPTSPAILLRLSEQLQRTVLPCSSSSRSVQVVKSESGDTVAVDRDGMVRRMVVL